MKIADHKKLIFNYDKIEQLDRSLKQLIKKDNRLQSIWNESRNYSNETASRYGNRDEHNENLDLNRPQEYFTSNGLKRSQAVLEEEDAEFLLWKPYVEPIDKNMIVSNNSNSCDNDKTPVKHWPAPKY